MKKLHTDKSEPRMSSSSSSDSYATGEGLFALVEGYFARYGRPGCGSQILVAVSGGPDSVALLSVLKNLSSSYDWGIGVAHVNHGLRGEESDADNLFVRRLARGLGLRLHSRRLNANAVRKERNLQAWARAERYKFFETLANRHGYSHIALAHQLNDRAETVAAAVLDAAGTFALSGIPPMRGMIIRPLFDAPREVIESFLTSHGITYRIDSSNVSIKYQRSRIRHTVLPQWKSENPGIVEGLARLGEQIWAQRRYLEENARGIVERALTTTQSSGVTLDLRALSRHDCALDAYILRELTARIGLDVVPRAALVSRFSEMRKRTANEGASSIEQGELAIRLSQGMIRVYRKRARAAVVQSVGHAPIAPKLTTRLVGRTAPDQSDDKVLARFDLDALEGELSVRWPRPGDRYQPIGLRGTKKLSDLLADRKVPSFERPLVPVVVDNRGILWPIGHPIAHRARLTDRTRRVMEARLQEGSWKNSS